MAIFYNNLSFSGAIGTSPIAFGDLAAVIMGLSF
jgi:hypothetical protein